MTTGYDPRLTGKPPTILDSCKSKHGDIKVYDANGELLRTEKPEVHYDGAYQKGGTWMDTGHKIFVCEVCGEKSGRLHPEVVICRDCGS